MPKRKVRMDTHLEALAFLRLVDVIEHAVVRYQQRLTLEWTNCNNRNNMLEQAGNLPASAQL